MLEVKPVILDKQENEQPDQWIIIALFGVLEPSSFQYRDQKQRFFIKCFCTGVKFSARPH